MDYYWQTMVKNCMEYAKKCQSCQFDSNFIHQPLEPLHFIVALWPFNAWGLDMVGPITSKSFGGHAYILTTIDCFSKWVETMPLKEVKKETMVNFIRSNIIY